MVRCTRFCPLLVAVFVLLCPPLTHGDSEEQPEIIKAVNDVTVKEAKSEDWLPTDVGKLLYTNDQVKTGQESRAEVDTRPGIIRLYQNALLTIPELGIGTNSDDKGRDIRLTRGAGIFKIDPRNIDVDHSPKPSGKSGWRDHERPFALSEAHEIGRSVSQAERHL